MKFKVVKRCQEDLSSVHGLLKSFLPFARKRMGFNRPPTIFFQSDDSNAQKLLGKTAHYEPDSGKITVYITGRHPKDVLRSLSHELVHHGQNCRSDLSPGSETAPGYAQSDDHMRSMEEEAYKMGNLCFRDWEDGIKTGKIKLPAPLRESMLREQDGHQVVAGENLSSIALKYYGDSHKWPLIYKNNVGTVGSDPDYIEVGMSLVIPDVSAWESIGEDELNRLYSLSSYYGNPGESGYAAPEDITPYTSGAYIFPVQGGRITSQFGMRGRIEKLARQYCDTTSADYDRKLCRRYSGPHMHKGIDIAAAAGTPILAPFDCKVTKAKLGSKSAGNFLTLKTLEERPIFHTFMHLSDRLPSVGTRFQKGDTVGYIGRSGAGTGAHLHWEVSTGPFRNQFDPLELYREQTLNEWKNNELNRLLLKKFNLGDI